MANHASAEKRNRQRIVRTERKRAQRSTVRTVVKQAREALRAGNAKLVPALVKEAESALARAAQKGVVTAKASARITSRLAAAAAKLGPTAAKGAPAPKAAAKR